MDRRQFLKVLSLFLLWFVGCSPLPPPYSPDLAFLPLPEATNEILRRTPLVFEVGKLQPNADEYYNNSLGTKTAELIPPPDRTNNYTEIQQVKAKAVRRAMNAILTSPHLFPVQDHPDISRLLSQFRDVNTDWSQTLKDRGVFVAPEDPTDQAYASAMVLSDGPVRLTINSHILNINGSPPFPRTELFGFFCSCLAHEIQHALDDRRAREALSLLGKPHAEINRVLYTLPDTVVTLEARAYWVQIRILNNLAKIDAKFKPSSRETIAGTLSVVAEQCRDWTDKKWTDTLRSLKIARRHPHNDNPYV